MAARIGSKAKREKKLAIIARDGEGCRYCGEMDRLTLDHILPKCLGGTNEISNLQFLCFTCNQAKGDTGAGRETVLRWRGVSVAA